jgi:hypothetical protein
MDTILAALSPHAIDPAFFARMHGPQDRPVAPGIVNGAVESIALSGTQLSISGWTLVWRDQALERCELLANGTPLAPLDCKQLPRPDVQRHFPLAPLLSGFQLTPERSLLPDQLESPEVQAKLPGLANSPLACSPGVDLQALRQALSAPPSMPGHIDRVGWSQRGLEIEGWGLMGADQTFDAFEILVDGQQVPVVAFRRLLRPDVKAQHPEAPVNLGFCLSCNTVVRPIAQMHIELFGLTSSLEKFRLDSQGFNLASSA